MRRHRHYQQSSRREYTSAMADLPRIPSAVADTASHIFTAHEPAGTEKTSPISSATQQVEPTTHPPVRKSVSEPAATTARKPAGEPANRAAVVPADTASDALTGQESVTPEKKRKRKKRRKQNKLTSIVNAMTDQVNIEEEFTRAVEAGDLQTVQRMLHNNRKLDANCRDLMEQTLRIAVQNENEEIVVVLLERANGRNMYESLLLAISLGHEGIALSILRHSRYAKLEQQNRLYPKHSTSSTREDSLFDAETTPIVLAAQNKRYKVLLVLLDSGAKVEEPHDVNCDCKSCETMLSSDELRYAKTRLNAFRGLASEAYICLTSPDPILTAFNLRQKLSYMAQNEKHYRDEYEELRCRLGQFVVKLLDCVGGNEELDVLLNIGKDGGYELLGRLHLALRYSEKMFVAHACCQMKLTTMWYGEAKKLFNHWPPWAQPLCIICTGICFPFTSMVYLLAPACKMSDYLRIPYIKFISQSASYFFFLFLICIFSIVESPSNSKLNIAQAIGSSNLTLNAFKKTLVDAGLAYSEYLREYFPPKMQMILNMFVIGMIWQECKQLYTSNLRDYFNSPFNVMETLAPLLYLVSFVLRYISCYKTSVAQVYFTIPENLKALTNKEPEALYRFYWLYADRYYWDAVDPLVVSEGFFAVANIVSFSRLFYLLAANEQLGPLQITLRRMVWDISRFLTIFMIVCMAFVVGLNNLYWYYAPDVRSVVELDAHSATETQSEEAFSTLEKTFTTLFWSIFGMSDSTVVQLSKDYQSGFTERLGYCIYGLYNVVIVVVLLNMLIAMMSRSFNDIAAVEDVEWKFARAQIYIDFISGDCTVPIPFNIIPSPKTLYRLIKTLTKRCKRRSSSSKHQTPPLEELNNMRHLGDRKDTPNGNKLILESYPLQDSKPEGASTSCVGHARPGDEQRGDAKSTTKKTSSNLCSRFFNPKRKLLPQHQTPFETVMKRLKKRYIFETEEVDAPQLEGDMDDLKQDISGVRFQINKLINTSQKVINSVNHVNARIDDVTGMVRRVQVDMVTLVHNAASSASIHPKRIREEQQQLPGFKCVKSESQDSKTSRPSPCHINSRMLSASVPHALTPKTAKLSGHRNQVKLNDIELSWSPFVRNRLQHPTNRIINMRPGTGHVARVKDVNRSRSMSADAPQVNVNEMGARCLDLDVDYQLMQRRLNEESNCDRNDARGALDDRYRNVRESRPRLGRHIYFNEQLRQTHSHDEHVIAPQVSRETHSGKEKFKDEDLVKEESKDENEEDEDEESTENEEHENEEGENTEGKDEDEEGDDEASAESEEHENEGKDEDEEGDENEEHENVEDEAGDVADDDSSDDRSYSDISYQVVSTDSRLSGESHRFHFYQHQQEQQQWDQEASWGVTVHTPNGKVAVYAQCKEEPEVSLPQHFPEHCYHNESHQVELDLSSDDMLSEAQVALPSGSFQYQHDHVIGAAYGPASDVAEQCDSVLQEENVVYTQGKTLLYPDSQADQLQFGEPNSDSSGMDSHDS